MGRDWAYFLTEPDGNRGFLALCLLNSTNNVPFKPKYYIIAPL